MKPPASLVTAAGRFTSLAFVLLSLNAFADQPRSIEQHLPSCARTAVAQDGVSVSIVRKTFEGPEDDQLARLINDAMPVFDLGIRNLVITEFERPFWLST